MEKSLSKASMLDGYRWLGFALARGSNSMTAIR
jgi:hypothetical protein